MLYRVCGIRYHKSEQSIRVNTGTTWYYDLAPVVYPLGVSGTLSAGLINQTATGIGALTDNLVNTTNDFKTVTYKFIPHIRPGDGGDECEAGVEITVEIVINPQPKIAVTTDTELCYDGPAKFDITKLNIVNTGTTWYYDIETTYPLGVTGSWPTGLTDQTATGIGALTDNLVNTTNDFKTVTYKFIPHIRPGDGGDECEAGVEVTIDIVINPQPKIAVTTDPELCYTGSAVFDITKLNTVNTGTTWYYDVETTYPLGVTGSWPTGLTDQTATGIGALTDNLVNTTNDYKTVTYKFIPHIRPGDGGDECETGVAITVEVVINPQPKIAVTTDTELCYDGPAKFDITKLNIVNTGTTWYYDIETTYPLGVTGSWPTGLTDQTATGIGALTDNIVNTTNDVQTVGYRFIPHIRPGDGDDDCADGVEVFLEIKINPRPRILVDADLELCYEQPATFDITNLNIVNPGATWYYNLDPVVYPGGITGTLSAGLTNQTATGVAALTDIIVNSNDVVGNIIYNFTPHIRPGDSGPECALGIPFSLTVRINPQPRIFPVPVDPAPQCDSTNTSIRLQSPSIFTTGAISFKYTVTSSGLVTGYTSPTSGLLNDQYITDKLANLTDTFRIVTYRLVPVSPLGCADGPAENVRVTVNPTPRATPVNLMPVICSGGITDIELKSPTFMTSGTIKFDYTVRFTGVPGDIIGNSDPKNDLDPGHKMGYSYKNIAEGSRIDSVSSVLYNIIPRVVNGPACKPGRIFTSEVQVHPKTLKRIDELKSFTCDLTAGLAALKVILTKGADPYQVRWTGPVGFQSNDVEIYYLNQGPYHVVVTDNNMCRDSLDKTITQIPARPRIFPSPIPPLNNHISCPGFSDGSLRAQVSAGISPPYQFWVIYNSTDVIGSGVFSGNFNPSNPNTYKIYNNLRSGSYRIRIIDANGCEFFENAELLEPDPITIQFQNTNVSCLGYSNGSSLAIPSGGNGGYIYQWSAATGLPLGVSSNEALLDSVPAGKYYIRVFDVLGCVADLDSVTLTELPGMTASPAVISRSAHGNTNVSCNGGNDGYINITINGGVAPLFYSWTGPDGFTSTLEDISGIKAGTYTVTVRDNTGCIKLPVDTYTLTEPPVITVTVTPSPVPNGPFNISCPGGTGGIYISASGGTGGTYTYIWTTSDGSGIVPGHKDQVALTAGTYRIAVQDSNSCEIVNYITLTQPAPITGIFDVTDITCQSAGANDGELSVTGAGGVGPYTYHWLNGSTADKITGLTEGYHIVDITDANGCTGRDSARVNRPPDLLFDYLPSDYNGYAISCTGLSNGTIDITPSSGTAPFVYNWTSSTGFTSTERNITGLKAGDYYLTILDSKYCTVTDTITLDEPGIPEIKFILSESNDGGFNLNCMGDSTGTIAVETENFAGAISYYWSDGNTDQIRTGLPAGQYDLIVSDANNCSAASSVTLIQPDSIRLAFSVIDPSCPDRPDGAIQLAVTGGVISTDYTYKWSDNSSTQNLPAVAEGDFSVIVTDFNGCTATDSLFVKAINETCLIIHNAISPNGDLINDVWNIENSDLYPEMEVKVINRWGATIWVSEKGYPKPWDGRSGGKVLPIDSYHYMIDVHRGGRIIVGNITIVK